MRGQYSNESSCGSIFSMILVKSQPGKALGAHSTLQLFIGAKKCRISRWFKYSPGSILSMILVKSQPGKALGAHSTLQLFIGTKKFRISRWFKHSPSTLVAVSATHWYLFVWYHVIREAPQNTIGAWIHSPTL
jgi:hypothetical protein